MVMQYYLEWNLNGLTRKHNFKVPLNLRLTCNQSIIDIEDTFNPFSFQE